MLKNLSFLALAGALTFAASMSACVVLTDDGSTDEVGDGDGDPTGDGDGDGAPGDGDGDGEPGDGDGDGEPGDGDGEPGDGDGEPGDGDGEPEATCGWIQEADPPGYYCDGEGEDPTGTVPIGCPDGLVEDDPCGTVTGAGCCDANGDNWYCAESGGEQFLVRESCG